MSEDRWYRWLGWEPDTTSHGEKLAAGFGGLCGIFAVSWVSALWLTGSGSHLMVASMGATAVLLFAVPHGPLSQPWSVFGGHLLSALIGVSCQRWISDPMLAAALAVSLAITVMYYLRCIHPPGGATALSAVIGGPEVHNLGYQFLLTPVLLNVLVLLTCAIAVNALFPWRRYPYRWFIVARKLRQDQKPEAISHTDGLTHADLSYALKTLDAYVDITEDELSRIYTLASQHQEAAQLSNDAIHLGNCYSNGRYGKHWSVRQIVDEAGNGAEDLLIYKTLAGAGRRKSGTCSRREFARWAKYTVERDETSWRRLEENEEGGSNDTT